MAESIWAVRHMVPELRLEEGLVKDILHHVICALAYLHQEAKVIHAGSSHALPHHAVISRPHRVMACIPDIREQNILLSLNNPEALQDFEDEERTHPVPRKVASDRMIYLSRIIRPKRYGPPVLCDFGEARFGREIYSGLIQPQQYRAPEVILGMPWNEKVDIWSVGVMVHGGALYAYPSLILTSRLWQIWNMFLDKNMFKVTGVSEDDDHPKYHLAHMVSLLGPPPVHFLKRSRFSEVWEYFDAQGERLQRNALLVLALTSNPNFRQLDRPKQSAKR